MTYLREKLVDNGIADAGAIVCRTTLLEDGVQLIEDDDVQATLVALLLVL